MPSSAKQQREMVKINGLWRTSVHGDKHFILSLNSVNAVRTSVILANCHVYLCCLCCANVHVALASHAFYVGACVCFASGNQTLGLVPSKTSVRQIYASDERFSSERNHVLRRWDVETLNMN